MVRKLKLKEVIVVKRSKLSVFVMVVCLFAIVLSSCGKGGNPAETTGPEDSTGGESAFAKQLEILWLGVNEFDLPPSETTGEGGIRTKIEQKFNVKIKPVPVDIFNSEQTNLFWAEGNTADYIFGSPIPNLVEQELVREITEEMIRKNMPTWMRKVESLVGAEMVKQQLYYKDKVYYVPSSNYSKVQTYIMAARKDWMDNVGITKTPETLEEFYEMLKKFATEDPDGNDEHDTYGIHGGTWMGFNYVPAAYGIQPNSYYLVDGKIVYTSTTEEYKELLKTLNKWFKEKLIDPEFVTDDRDVQRKKWAEGRFGVLVDHPWWFAKSTSGNLTDMLAQANPNAEVIYFEAFEGPDGKSGGMQSYPNLHADGFCFGRNTSDEKVERIMAIMESFAVDWDWYVECYFGEKGKHYNLDKDGKIELIPEINTPEIHAEEGLSGYFAESPLDLDDYKKFTAIADLPPYQIAEKNKMSYTGVAFPVSGVNEAEKTKGTDITTIAQEFYYNAITGNVDIDAEWDNYIKRLNEAGLQEVLAEYEKIAIK
jgi:putative aldouronate transport system substrate-binding protein